MEEMKSSTIDLGTPVLSRGSAHDLHQHYETLRQEFSGQPELVFYHAFLISLIRREYKTQESYAAFLNLWENNEAWLMENLNIRWLVSACDTFADHSPDITERALAIGAALLANTVKAYETENILTHQENVLYDANLVAHLQTKAIPLFEGMSCYTIGTDDTLRNMVWRMEPVASKHIAGRILLAVFHRFSHLNTAFGRLRSSHHRKKTEWWN